MMRRPHSLQYEGEWPRRVRVEQVGDEWTITVPYRGPWPIHSLRSWNKAVVGSEHHLVAWLIGLFSPTPPRPPRLLIVVGRDAVAVEELDVESGKMSRRVWPRKQVIELRKNQYQPSIWIFVEGKEVDDLGIGMDEKTVSELDEAIQDAMRTTA